jgi:hypothetical protein
LQVRHNAVEQLLQSRDREHNVKQASYCRQLNKRPIAEVMFNHTLRYARTLP